MWLSWLGQHSSLLRKRRRRKANFGGCKNHRRRKAHSTHIPPRLGYLNEIPPPDLTAYNVLFIQSRQTLFPTTICRTVFSPKSRKLYFDTLCFPPPPPPLTMSQYFAPPPPPQNKSLYLTNCGKRIFPSPHLRGEEEMTP